MQKQIQEIREKLNLSDDEISEKFEITKSSWYDIETGVSEVPVKLFKKLLHLGISAGWLLSGNGEMFVLEEQEAVNDDKIITDEFKIELIKLKLKEIDRERTLLENTLKDLEK